jgi:hypothetical protein
MYKINLFTFVIMLIALISNAQDKSMETLSLEDMSSFKQQAGNWQIVGDVTMDPLIDVHQSHTTPVEPAGKKKKKSKDQPQVEQPKPVYFNAGKGILLNMNNDTRKDNLVTSWEHGDIELELEVMIPKGSNSGIYLQGRYEVQLFDSWGVNDPKFSDLGGIYRNWETDPAKIYMGKAPLSNPAKAPGLWQTLKISFSAPRFDANGKKIANAKFVSVVLNGVKIHDNVEVPQLTGGPIESNEKALGPLMIQGDHGAVAFRNIKYKLMKEVVVTLTDITYKSYLGTFKVIDDFINAKPATTGTVPAITCEVANTDNAYALTFDAKLTVPEDATYDLTLAYSGGARLILNGNQLFEYQRADGSRTDKTSVTLKAGTYPITIYNYKDVSWIPPRLAFFVSTANSYPQALHAFNSFPPDENPVASIYINPGSETKLLRAFLDFKGDRKNRLTHTIGVGDPNQIHYVYDLNSGNIVCAWHGDFVDATPMWHDRGDGSFKPRGAVQYLFTDPPLAYLASPQTSFPKSTNEEDFKSNGYEIEESSGRPVFNYIYKGLTVADHVYPDDGNRILTHEISLKETPQPNLFYKLAEGSSVVLLPNGNYAIDDKHYYLKVSGELNPIIRDSEGKQELLVPFSGPTLKYSIIW